jgi:hypothetical protein
MPAESVMAFSTTLNIRHYGVLHHNTQQNDSTTIKKSYAARKQLVMPIFGILPFAIMLSVVMPIVVPPSVIKLKVTAPRESIKRVKD